MAPACLLGASREAPEGRQKWLAGQPEQSHRPAGGENQCDINPDNGPRVELVEDYWQQEVRACHSSLSLSLSLALFHCHH